jgi:hypothetical protein
VVDDTPLPPGSEDERARFSALQPKLRDRFLRFSDDPRQPYTAVVIPSQSVDKEELKKIDGVAHYEERSLFNLMLLRRPRMKVIYVTSKRLNPLVVDYFLHQLRGVPNEHARRRLLLLDCDDASPRPLTEKILERPRLLQRIREAIDDREMAHVNVFNSSPLERTLAVRLGIPLYACDPDLTHLGSKTGSRTLFKECGLPVADGAEGLRDAKDVADGLAALWEREPDLRRAVVKLDESFSGEGNAVFDFGLVDKARPGSVSTTERARAIYDALPQLRFEAAGLSWEHYAAQFEQMGGVCEAWIEGDDKASPSVQMRINPLSEAQAVSTHDQVLGGPSGQVFVGATFPADESYRLAIQRMGLAVGKKLADRGVIGRFAVDFLARPPAEPGGDPRLWAVEINLRAGGTTHPFNTLKFMTDGRYDEETGEFTTAQGSKRGYFATDNLSSERYRGILPFDLIDELVMHQMHFRADETGVVFHLLGCLSEYGKLGCTAIAPDVARARALYDETIRLLDDMSASGHKGGTVPPASEESR